MDDPANPLYEFSPFRVDAQRHLLPRGDESVPPRPGAESQELPWRASRRKKH